MMERQNDVEAGGTARATSGATNTKKQRTASEDFSTIETPSDGMSAGLKNSLHGNAFQLKLLMLFLIRGIRNGYKFSLGTEMPGIGGKFDDLVFLHDGKYRFLQAKHKQDRNVKIRAKDLLNETDGEFSLLKYFRSYCNEIEGTGKTIMDCIICTNIGFDWQNLKDKGIRLKVLKTKDDLLTFENATALAISNVRPARFQLQMNKSGELTNLFKQNSEVLELAKKLVEDSKKKKKLALISSLYRSYHVALVTHVIDKSKGKFHQNFIDNKDLKQGVSNFRDILCSLDPLNPLSWESLTFECSKDFGISKGETSDGATNTKSFDDAVTNNENVINDFFSKLVFAVNMPDEIHLGNILTKEVGEHFKLLECDFHSDYITRTMFDWFKDKISDFFTRLRGENIYKEIGMKMASLQATHISNNYRELCLPKPLEFQQAIVEKKAEELKEFLKLETSSILYITTNSWRCTSVKIIKALDSLSDFKDVDDGYLLMPSSYLKNEKQFELVATAMQSEKAHRVLVVVCDIPRPIHYQSLIFNSKKAIVIGNDGFFTTTNDRKQHDEVNGKELSDSLKDEILRAQIQFQGSNRTIGDVMGNNELDEVLDSSTIEEFIDLSPGRKLTLCFSDKFSRFDDSIYIKRSLILPTQFDDQFCDQLAKELNWPIEELERKCRFHPTTANIEWLVDDKDTKSKICEKIQTLLQKPALSDISTYQANPVTISEDDLISKEWKDRRVIVLAGLPGSGKSTVLSRYNELITSNDAKAWVIRINLVDHSEYLSDQKLPFKKSALDLLLDFPGVICNNSPFARSLIRHRLTKGGRIVLMLDGLDEINEECQDVVIAFMKIINMGQTKLDRLIVTTRSHLTEKLQNELFQFAFSLENLGKDSQVNYLVQYWQKELRGLASVNDDEQFLWEYAEALVERVTAVLQDRERAFIGIPLQCRILAECFKSQIEAEIKRRAIDPVTIHHDSLGRISQDISQDYSVGRLYEMLFERKRDILRKEKSVNSMNSDVIVKWAEDEFLQTTNSFHLRLSIDTIFEEKHARLLLPPQQLNDRQVNQDEKDRQMIKYSLQSGLTVKNPGSNKRGVQFLHRTFAEYIVAEFMYKGYMSEENNNKNATEAEEPLLDFMDHHILVDNNYQGVRVFLDSMLKKMVTNVDENWRDTILKEITTESQPNQLQRFALHFSLNYLPSQKIGGAAHALPKAWDEGNAGIFVFLIDCLGAVYKKSYVQEIVNELNVFPSYSRSAEINKCIWDFSNDANDKILNRMMSYVILCFPFSHINFYSTDDRKAFTNFVLDFMEKHQTCLQNLDPENLPHHFLLHTNASFIFGEDYDGELRKFMELLIKEIYNKKGHSDYFAVKLSFNAFDDDDSAIYSKNENWSSGKIEKILGIVQDLDATHILESLWRLVLIRQPELYKKLYKPYSTSAKVPLERQFMLAVVENNEESCYNLVQSLNKEKHGRIWVEYFICDAFTNAVELKKTDMFILLVRIVRRSYGHQAQQALHHILTFEPDVLSNPLIKSATVGVLMGKAFMVEEDEPEFYIKVLFDVAYSSTINVSLRSSTDLVLGQFLGYLNQHQLKKLIEIMTSSNIWAANFGVIHSIFIDTILEIISKKLGEEEVEKLILHESDNGVLLYHTSLVAADTEGVEKVCARHLSKENQQAIVRDFYDKAPSMILTMIRDPAAIPTQPLITLVDILWCHLKSSHDVWEFLNIVLSPLQINNKGEINTFWEYLINHLKEETFFRITKCITDVMTKKEAEDIMKLILYDKNQIPPIVIRIALQRGKEFVQKLCVSLPEANQLEILQCFQLHSSQWMEKNLFSSDEPASSISDSSWNNTLNFVVDYCSSDEMENFIDVVTKSHKFNGEMCSIWGRYLDELDELHNSETCRNLVAFLANVGRKMGEDSVIKLLLNDDGKGVAFIRISHNKTLNISTLLSNEKQIDFRKKFSPVLEQFTEQVLQGTSNFWLKFAYEKTIRSFRLLLDYSNADQLSTNFESIITSKQQGDLKNFTTWEFLCNRLLTYNEVAELNSLLKYVAEKLGKNVMEELVLKRNREGQFIINKAYTDALNSFQEFETVKTMCAHLPKEKWKTVFEAVLSEPKTARKLNVEMGSQSFSDNSDGMLAMYVDVIKSLRIGPDKTDPSIWANYVANSSVFNENIQKFFKRISNVLGEEAVKELLLHDWGHGESVVVRAIRKEENARLEIMLSLLSKPAQTEIYGKAFSTPGLVERMLSKRGSDYWTLRCLGMKSPEGLPTILPKGFNDLVIFFLEKFNPQQLKQFVEFITYLNKTEDGRTRSIWSDYIDEVCSHAGTAEEHHQDSVDSINRLLKLVSSQLGAVAVVKLLFHYDGNCVVINRPALKARRDIAEIIIKYDLLGQQKEESNI